MLKTDLMNNEVVEQQIEEPITFAQKIRMLAKALRNHKGVFQITKACVDQDKNMCAIGLAAFNAGCPTDGLKNYTGNEDIALMKYYGFTFHETNRILLDYPYRVMANIGRKKASITRQLWGLNDKGWSFDAIADHLDKIADSLEREENVSR